jgi:alpha-1,3-mannosyltransferase
MPGKRFDKVLFMNDILFCAEDVLELLFQHDLQEADMACSMDWGSDVVYDRYREFSLAR